MTDLNTGLFICNKLDPHKENKGKRYCRIIGASTYTSILKSKKMLVAYKVGYWDEEPIDENDFSRIKTYRSQRDGNIIIVFEHPRVYLSKEDLITACMNHFLDFYFRQHTPKILFEEVDKLYKVRTRKYTRSIMFQEHMVMAWDIVHKARYESTNGLYPVEVENNVRYRGNFFLNKLPRFNWEFDTNEYVRFNTIWKEDLTKDVLTHLDTQVTINYCNDNFGS